MKGGFYISKSVNGKYIHLNNRPISGTDTDIDGEVTLSITVPQIKELIKKLGFKPPNLKKKELLETLIRLAQDSVYERNKAEATQSAKKEADGVARAKARRLAQSDAKRMAREDAERIARGRDQA